jgi:hypothetical protein
MSDRDVFPADVSRNLQQPIPEVKALRKALDGLVVGESHKAHVAVYVLASSARALLAYVENEPARMADVYDRGHNDGAMHAIEAKDRVVVWANPYRSGGQTNG